MHSLPTRSISPRRWYAISNAYGVFVRVSILLASVWEVGWIRIRHSLTETQHDNLVEDCSSCFKSAGWLIFFFLSRLAEGCARHDHVCWGGLVDEKLWRCYGHLGTWGFHRRRIHVVSPFCFRCCLVGQKTLSLVFRKMEG